MGGGGLGQAGRLPSSCEWDIGKAPQRPLELSLLRGTLRVRRERYVGGGWHTHRELRLTRLTKEEGRLLVSRLSLSHLRRALEEIERAR